MGFQIGAGLGGPVGSFIGAGIGAVGGFIVANSISGAGSSDVPGSNVTPTDQIRDPSRSRRGEARCRCKAATNAEGGRGPTPQEWFYAESTGATMADAARAACRQANKYIGTAYPGCQGEHCHCVCSENVGPPIPYNPR